MNIDPLGSDLAQIHLSPYQFGWNNPINLNDPSGKCPPGVPCVNPLPNMKVRRNRASNLGPGDVRPAGRNHAGHDLQATTGTPVSSSMAGEVVSSYNSTSFGNTVVVKTNVHPEAQADFVGPLQNGAPGEDFVYTQYSHLDSRDVDVGAEVTMGQNIGTTGTTGNASGMTGDDEHLHIQVGTEMATPNRNVDNNSTVSPNLVYNGVSFYSANPNGNQSQTGVIKQTGNTLTYQPYNQTNNDRNLNFNPREFLQVITAILGGGN